jgi:hypothetical protein
MPCTREPLPWEIAEDNEKRAINAKLAEADRLHTVMDKMRKELEQLTQMLCEACSLSSESMTTEGMFSDELGEWWNCHKKHDEAKTRDVINDFFSKNKFTKYQIQYLYDYIFSEYM